MLNRFTLCICIAFIYVLSKYLHKSPQVYYLIKTKFALQTKKCKIVLGLVFKKNLLG